MEWGEKGRGKDEVRKKVGVGSQRRAHGWGE